MAADSPAGPGNDGLPTPAAGGSTCLRGCTRPVLVHQVYFWLKDKGNAAQIADLKAELAALTAIPHIQLLYVGTPASTEKRTVVDYSFDVSELMYFASQAEHDAYQVHPLHKAFADKWTPLLEKVIVYDSVLE